MRIKRELKQWRCDYPEIAQIVENWGAPILPNFGNMESHRLVHLEKTGHEFIFYLERQETLFRVHRWQMIFFVEGTLHATRPCWRRKPQGPIEQLLF